MGGVVAKQPGDGNASFSRQALVVVASSGVSKVVAAPSPPFPTRDGKGQQPAQALSPFPLSLPIPCRERRGCFARERMQPTRDGKECSPSMRSKEGLWRSNQGMGTQLLPCYARDGKATSSTVASSGSCFATTTTSGTEAKNLQEKTVELAVRYNNQSIEAITNFFADLISFLTLFYLIKNLEIQVNIAKSFLLEVFFGLDDSKKSLLILLATDLLVGYHSSNIWELLFEFLFNHYGLPESQTGIFLLVATLPVLLDVLFKYLIFRHLNRSSPATVATYHAMIE
jgi:hypothetical protein